MALHSPVVRDADRPGNRRASTRLTDCSTPGAKACPLSLLLIDVDHFKLYNDTYGHQRGCLPPGVAGSCLWCFARRLAARHGGEEFAVIMPSPIRTAPCGWPSVRAAVAELNTPSASQTTDRVTRHRVSPVCPTLTESDRYDRVRRALSLSIPAGNRIGRRTGGGGVEGACQTTAGDVDTRIGGRIVQCNTVFRRC
jgi:GGDEF domain-containing protein